MQGRQHGSVQGLCGDLYVGAVARELATKRPLCKRPLRPHACTLITQVTLEPYERDHAVVVGVYRPPSKKKD